MRLFLQWNTPIDRGNGPTHPFPRALLSLDIDIDATSAAFANILMRVHLEGLTTNYTIAALNVVQGTKYYFRVRANNSAGFSPFSTDVAKTAIASPTPPGNFAAVVTSSLETTLSWDTPLNTGGIAQTWGLLNYSVYMATNVNYTDDLMILEANLNTHVEIELTKAVQYYFRVFAINQAGTGPASNSDREEGVVLQTTPMTFELSVTGEVQLRVKWRLPADTGTGGNNRPLLYYILEVDDVFSSNGSFATSPYSIDPNTTCFVKAVASCDPSQNNVMAVPGVDLLLTNVTLPACNGATLTFSEILL